MRLPEARSQMPIPPSDPPGRRQRAVRRAGHRDRDGVARAHLQQPLARGQLPHDEAVVIPAGHGAPPVRQQRGGKNRAAMAHVFLHRGPRGHAPERHEPVILARQDQLAILGNGRRRHRARARLELGDFMRRLLRRRARGQRQAGSARRGGKNGGASAACWANGKRWQLKAAAVHPTRPCENCGRRARRPASLRASVKRKHWQLVLWGALMAVGAGRGGRGFGRMPSPSWRCLRPSPAKRRRRGSPPSSPTWARRLRNTARHPFRRGEHRRRTSWSASSAPGAWRRRRGAASDLVLGGALVPAGAARGISRLEQPGRGNRRLLAQDRGRAGAPQAERRRMRASWRKISCKDRIAQHPLRPHGFIESSSDQQAARARITASPGSRMACGWARRPTSFS